MSSTEQSGKVVPYRTRDVPYRTFNMCEVNPKFLVTLSGGVLAFL